MIKIDKNLPVSLTTQIEGFIEFGVMLGQYYDNPKLPSVKKLSQELGVSYVTVASAYQNLKLKGIIVTKAGDGTYINEFFMEEKKIVKMQNLKKDMLHLLFKAKSLGASAEAFLPLFSQVFENDEPEYQLKIAYIGNSSRINQQYINCIKDILDFNIQFSSYNFDDMYENGASYYSRYDGIFTIPHCKYKVQSFLKKQTKLILAPILTASDIVIDKINKLTPSQNILLVSRFDSFLMVMLGGIQEINPSLKKITPVVLSQINLQRLSNDHDVIIYSTGCYSSICQLEDLPYHFEYDHIPQVFFLETQIIPKLKLLKSTLNERIDNGNL